jgi:hypothetical protein
MQIMVLSFIYLVEPSSLLLLPFIALLYQTWVIDGDDSGAKNDWQGKPTPWRAAQCRYVHHRSHDLSRAETRVSAVGSRRLITKATARPAMKLT